MDIISLGVSVVEVIANPTDVWNWLGLVGDALDLIPFATGIGESTRLIKIAIKASDGATDVISNARKTYNALSKMDEIAGIVKPAGFYEIAFKSGFRYVGKGNLYRASVSALFHATKYTDEVTSIIWKSAPNNKLAFVAEYLLQRNLGFKKKGKLRNKIWSPGRKIYDAFKIF